MGDLVRITSRFALPARRRLVALGGALFVHLFDELGPSVGGERSNGRRIGVE